MSDGGRAVLVVLVSSAVGAAYFSYPRSGPVPAGDRETRATRMDGRVLRSYLPARRGHGRLTQARACERP